MKNLPKCREIDSALTRRFTCVSGTGAPCVRACLGCACGGRAGSTNSRRIERVYHAATAADGARTTDSVRGRFRRRPNVATAAAATARSSNPATQQKPLCVVVRSNARSIARSPLIAHLAAAGAACAYDGRGNTTINEMIKTRRRPALAKRTLPSNRPRPNRQPAAMKILI